jgi:ferredoxin--NADP+ reductase
LAAKTIEENATVVRYEALSGCLYRLWVRPDWDLSSATFEPGQFVRLGLVTGDETDKKLARAYSFVGVQDGVFEFYVVAVEGGKTSPRLGALREGDRLWCEEKIAGHFTVSRNPPGARCVMVGTGAGIAPFLCTLRHDAEALAAYEGVALVHQVRDPAHLEYGAELAAWAAEDDRRRYIPIVSKPPDRLTVRDGHAALHGHVQDALEDGRLERLLGGPLTADTVVMLCGNPDMIKAMTTALEARGLAKHKKSKPGQIVSERYW